MTPKLARELGLRERSGVLVAEVQDGGPAAEAGLQPGNVIVQANRKPVRTSEEFERVVQRQKTGEPLLLRVHRRDTSRFVTLEVGKTPQG